MDNGPIDQFLKQIKKYEGMWQLIEITLVAGMEKGQQPTPGLSESPEPRYRLLGLRAVLTLGDEWGSDVLFDGANLLILREFIPVSELGNLLSGLSGEHIFIGGKEIKTQLPQGWACGTFAAGKGFHGILSAYIGLSLYGPSIGELVDESAIERRLSSWGYRLLGDLTENKAGFRVGGSHTARMEILAPIYISVKGDFEDNDLVVNIEVHSSVNSDDLKVFYQIEDTVKIVVVSTRFELIDTMSPVELPLQEFEVSAGDPFHDFNLRKRLPAIVSSVRLWLLHKKGAEPIETVFVRKEPTSITSPIWTALSVALSKRHSGSEATAEQTLERALSFGGAPKDANRFEAAIHNLLVCCGYACLFTGKPLDAQGIDMLAFNNRLDRVVAISVTISNKLGEKLRTLLPVLRELAEQRNGKSIVGAFFAPVEPADLLPSDVDDAGKKGVRLVLLPDIRQLWDTVKRGTLEDAEKCLDNLLFST